jgi:hypothetical protein
MHPQPWSWPTGASPLAPLSGPVVASSTPPPEGEEPPDEVSPEDDPPEDDPPEDDPPEDDPTCDPTPTMGPIGVTHPPVAGSQELPEGHGVTKQAGTQKPPVHS